MLRPIEDVILVEPYYDQERVSYGGVVIPKTVKNEAVAYGIILAVGPGKVNKQGVFIPVSVEVGQKIYYILSSAIEYVDVDGKKYHFIDETVSLAVED